jgi:hypothetical protein
VKLGQLPISEASSVGCLIFVGSDFKTSSGKKERRAVQRGGSIEERGYLTTVVNHYFNLLA